MPLAQDYITPSTHMGANLVGNGATFRVWAPDAYSVYVCYDGHWQPEEANLLVRDVDGYWSGYAPGIKDGTLYKFYVIGPGLSGYKRDPYARELVDEALPACIVRDPAAYPWHDEGFSPPPFDGLIIYQLHVGTFYVPNARKDGGNFLDILDRLNYLVALGVNAIQLLPIVEFPSQFSMGYNGTDLFSPETHYVSEDPEQLEVYLATINALFARAGREPLQVDQLKGATNQLKALIDACHVYGLAVILDVVYNHAGGGFDAESIFFFDKGVTPDNNESLYFTNQGWAGGLIFAYWKKEVRQFLIDNARFFIEEYHVDGFRYDEVSVIVNNSGNGWGFCQDLTATVRYDSPPAIQVAEHWPEDPWVVTSEGNGGAGFDTAWDNRVRDSVRAALAQAAHGRDSWVSMDEVAAALRYTSDNLLDPWKAVRYLESHDEVYEGRSPRIAALCDPSGPRSWYARSRARMAIGLLLTAPGIPMLFMGEEFLEDNPWSDNLDRDLSDLISWTDLEAGLKPAVDYLRYTTDLVRVRLSRPALRKGSVNVFHVNNASRVIAYHRWIENEGRDVVVVASLNEDPLFGYELGFPLPGRWYEILNSDVYDNWVNPLVVGNAGSISAGGPPMHGLPHSSSIVIPANGFLVFAPEAL